MRKRIFSFVLAAVMVITMLPGIVLEADAATFDDINRAEVFLKQKTDYTCTLAATAMLMRRRAMIEGKGNWSDITENALRPVAWTEGEGLKGTFSYNGITITAVRKNSGIPRSELIDLLQKHPEGVVVHNDAHAVLLTDYDSKTGIFYCADPSYGAQGRVPLNHPETCHYKMYGRKTQDAILNSIVHYWYAVGEVKLGGSAPAPSEPAVTFGAWEQDGKTYITETDASIGQSIVISNGANPSDSGIYLYDANGNHIATGSNGQLSQWWDYVYFKINEECGYALTPGTTYKYKFYVVVNGKTYWSPEGSFKTNGTSAPSEPTVSFGAWEQSGYTYIAETDASIGQSIVISNGANPSDSGIYLYDANGNHIATGSNGQLSQWWDYVYFKINEECGYTLTPGTTYKYKFYVIVNGKAYWGPEGSFKTNGSAAVAVTGVTLDKQSLSLRAGESASLVYAVKPANAADQTIRVSSSDRSVATVSVSGNTIRVEGKSAGTASVTVTTTDGGYTASCKVAVTESIFNDVDESAWYYPAVKFVSERDVMSGYSSGLFGPNDNLSRAMVVQVLYNAAGQPNVTAANPFSDVPSGQWFTNAVRWGVGKKIVSGFGDGEFRPNDSLTVEQLAVILYNYSGSPAVSGVPSGVGRYSSWAANAMRWAQDQNILNGVPFDDATEPATRAQTAQVLMNFLG